MSNNNDFLNGYKSGGNGSSGKPKTSMTVNNGHMINKEKSKFSKPKNDKPTDSKKDGNGKSSKSKTSMIVNSDNMIYKEKSKFSKPKKYDRPSGMKKGGNSKLIKNLIIAAVVLAAVVVGLIVLISSGSKIEVPDFKGWTVNDFMLWVKQNDVLAQKEEQFSDTTDAETIISQSVAVGEQLKQGAIIKVTVSKGPDLSVELDMPDVKTMTKAEIEKWAEDNKMSKVRITSEFSDTVPVGKVIKCQVNDNRVVDRVKRDTPIYIVISKGPESEESVEITVPDCKTQGVAATQAFAKQNGLVLKIEEEYNDYIEKGSIISVSAKPESKLNKGDELKIVVSLGKKVLMPSFKSLSKEDAAALASTLNLTLTVKERYSSSSEGKMISQSIGEGTLITEKMRLELTYSLGNKISLTSYVGQHKHELEQWMSEQNEKGAKLKLKVTTTNNSADVGTVLQQDIKNTFVKRGTTISVVVSAGQVVFMPDLVAVDGAGYDTAITREKAEVMVKDLGLILVFKEEAAPNRLPGEIWNQSVTAGQEVKSGTTITLKFNPVNKTLDVPNFIGQTEAEIRATDIYKKLNVKFTTGEPCADLAGKVSMQSLPAGQTVAYGTMITLAVAPEVAQENSPPTEEGN